MRQIAVLPGYSPMRTPVVQRLRTLGLTIAAVLLAIWTGLGVGFLPAQLLVFPALPIVAIALILLWIIPDVDSYPEAWMMRAFGVATVASMVWPRYLAFTLPGLPWITPSRLAFLVLTLLFIASLATSARFRSQMLLILNYSKTIKYALILFTLASLGGTIISHDTSVVAKLVNDQIYWTMTLFASALYFSKTGRVKTAATWLIWVAAFLSLLGLAEYYKGHILWINYIYLFNIPPDMQEKMAEVVTRLGSDRYRTHSVFSTPLEMAEFLSFVIPFVWYDLLERRSFWRMGLSALLLLCILVAIWAADSRLGMVSFVLTLLAYPALFGYKSWRANRSSLIGPSILLAYPFGFIAAVGAIFVSGRLHTAVLGGGQHSYSDQARIEQWREGLAKLAHNPFGYGPNNGAVVLNFRSPGGDLTIDSYYLSLLLDTGILGALSFFVMFATAMIVGIKLYLRSSLDSEESYAGAAALAVLNFMVIKIVLSQDSNQWFAFALIGLIIGIGLRERTRVGSH